MKISSLHTLAMIWMRLLHVLSNLNHHFARIISLPPHSAACFRDIDIRCTCWIHTGKQNKLLMCNVSLRWWPIFVFCFCCPQDFIIAYILLDILHILIHGVSWNWTHERALQNYLISSSTRAQENLFETLCCYYLKTTARVCRENECDDDEKRAVHTPFLCLLKIDLFFYYHFYYYCALSKFELLSFSVDTRRHTHSIVSGWKRRKCRFNLVICLWRDH